MPEELMDHPTLAQGMCLASFGAVNCSVVVWCENGVLADNMTNSGK